MNELQAQGKSVIFRNERERSLYVRVYEEFQVEPEYAECNGRVLSLSWAKGKLNNAAEYFKSKLTSRYQKCSEIIKVKPHTYQVIAIDEDSFDFDFHIYYTTAKNIKKAQESLIDVNPKKGEHEELELSKVSNCARIVVERTLSEKVKELISRIQKKNENQEELLSKTKEYRKISYINQKELDRKLGIPEAITSSGNDISISNCEKKFWEIRDKVNQSAMRKIFDFSDLPENPVFPRIGMCSSGGGFRAQTVFSGFLQGMTEEGLTDVLGCISATSGSTWTLADWILNEGDPKTHQTFCKRTEKGYQRGVFAKEDLNLDVAALLRAGKMPDEEDGVIDMLNDWAQGLYSTALAGVDEEKRLIPFYELDNKPKLMPLIIGNTISTTQVMNFSKSVEGKDIFKPKYITEHQETTVFDITFIPSKKDRPTLKKGKKIPFCRIPTRALGRKFNKERKAELTKQSPTPQSVLAMTATWGSALSVDLNKIVEESDLAGFMMKKLSHYSGLNVNPKKMAFFPSGHEYSKDKKKPTELPHSGQIEGLRIKRPILGRGGKEAILRDAGIGSNLPIEAIVRPKRGCNLAIVFDTSGNLNLDPGKELFNAMENVKTFGRKLPVEFKDKKLFKKKVKDAIDSGKLPIVFGDPEDPKEYCIIYVPTVKPEIDDDDLGVFVGKWEDYDPMDNSTGKLRYEPKDQRMLHTYGRKMAKHVAPKIKEVINTRIQALNHDDNNNNNNE